MTKRDENGRFPPGTSGNPGGRPEGTRLALQGKFLRALSQDFDEHGVSAIERCRKRDPSTYVKVIAALMPKQIEQTKPLDDMTDDELIAAIAWLRSQLNPQDAGTGAGTTH